MKKLKGYTILESLVSIVLLLIIVRIAFNSLWMETTRIDELRFIKSSIDYYGLFEQTLTHGGEVQDYFSGAKVFCKSKIYDETNGLYEVMFEITSKKKKETITFYIRKR